VLRENIHLWERITGLLNQFCNLWLAENPRKGLKWWQFGWGLRCYIFNGKRFGLTRVSWRFALLGSIDERLWKRIVSKNFQVVVASLELNSKDLSHWLYKRELNKDMLRWYFPGSIDGLSFEHFLYIFWVEWVMIELTSFQDVKPGLQLQKSYMLVRLNGDLAPGLESQILQKSVFHFWWNRTIQIEEWQSVRVSVCQLPRMLQLGFPMRQWRWGLQSCLFYACSTITISQNKSSQLSYLDFLPESMLVAKLSSIQMRIILRKIFWMSNEESSCVVRTEDNQQEENSTSHYPQRHFLLQTPFPSPMKDAFPDGNVGARRLQKLQSPRIDRL